MEYEIGKVYQVNKDHGSLFEIQNMMENGCYEIWCINGHWEGHFNSVNNELFIPATKTKVVNFYLVEPFEDIGYGYVGKNTVDTDGEDDWNDYIPF